MPAVTPTPLVKPLWQKRIPTLLGLGFLVVALVVGVLFLGKGMGVFAPRATAETTPKNVRLTNVSDSSFTVSFMTEIETTSFVKYGTEENKVTLQVADDRIQLSATNDKYKLHHITVKGLQPGTPYYYFIGTGDGALFDNNGAAFKVVTAKKGIPTSARTVFGTVTTPTGAPAEGAVVYLKTDGVGDMSSLVTNAGNWAVALSNARTVDGSSFAAISDDTQLSLVVQGVEVTQTAQATISVADAKSGIPNITFGKGIAIASPAASQSAQITTTTQTSMSGSTTGIESASESAHMTASGSGRTTALGGLNGALDASASGSASSSAQAEVVSLNLEKDFKTEEPPVVTTQQPTIVGKAAPNVKVKIEVHSDNHITDEVTADSKGQFSVDLEELKATLEPGEHTITYTYNDPITGQPQTKTETFVVQPRTENLIAQANTSTTKSSTTNTGSTASSRSAATATPKVSATPFGSSNPYPIGGATSSAQASGSTSSTKSGTKSASSSASSTRSSKISTASGLPVSGAIGTTLALIFGGLFFIIAGTWSYWVSASVIRSED